MSDWWQRYFGGGGEGMFPPANDTPDPLGHDYQPPTQARFDPPTSNSFPDQKPKFEWPVIRNETQTPPFLAAPWEDVPPDSFFEPPPDYSQPGYAPNQAIQMSMQDTGDYTDPNFEPAPLNQDYGGPPTNDASVVAGGPDFNWQWPSPQNNQLWQNTPGVSAPPPSSTPAPGMPAPPSFFDTTGLQGAPTVPLIYEPPGSGGDQPQVQNASLDFSSEETGIPIEPELLPQNQGVNNDAVTGDIPYGVDPGVERNPAPWYPGRPDVMFSADRNVYGTPKPPGLLTDLGKPTNWQNAGKLITDAAGNIVDATGKIIATAAQVAAKLGTAIGQIPGNIADSIPKDWGGFGEPAGFFGVRSQNPIGVFGVGGETMRQGGGSYFGATMNLNPGLSSPYQGFQPTTQNPGQVGSSSVPAPGGFGGGFGGGGPINLGGTSWGNALNQAYLRRMYKGLYTSPQNYSQAMVQSPSPFPNAPAPNFQAFHQGQVQLGNILRTNPAIFSQFPGGSGRPPNTSRGTPPVLPK
jgi:hypothetical protein